MKPVNQSSKSAERSEEVVATRAQGLIAMLRKFRASPIPARDAALHLGVSGKDTEVLRRRVREAAAYAREVLGEMVCANWAGYWLARDVAEYTMYEEHRRANTRFAFVAAKKRRRAVSDKNTGQKKLFGAKR